MEMARIRMSDASTARVEEKIARKPRPTLAACCPSPSRRGAGCCAFARSAGAARSGCSSSIAPACRRSIHCCTASIAWGTCCLTSWSWLVILGAVSAATPPNVPSSRRTMSGTAAPRGTRHDSSRSAPAPSASPKSTPRKARQTTDRTTQRNHRVTISPTTMAAARSTSRLRHPLTRASSDMSISGQSQPGGLGIRQIEPLPPDRPPADPAGEERDELEQWHALHEIEDLLQETFGPAQVLPNHVVLAPGLEHDLLDPGVHASARA